MNRILYLAVFSLLLAVAPSAPARAQTPQAPAPKPAAAVPTVDQVLDKYVQALGGKAAIEKLTSRVSKGTFEAPGIEGSIEIYAKAPNKAASMVDVPGFGQVRQAFDGSVGWVDNPQVGLREMSGQELSTTKRGAEFYQVLKLREFYPKLTLKGAQKLGTRDAYLIEADPGDGSLRRMYFDTQTALLVRSDIERDTPQGRATFETELEDYKEVDGVKVPFIVRQSTPALSYAIKLTEVRHNVPVDDARFAKPAAQ